MCGVLITCQYFPSEVLLQSNVSKLCYGTTSMTRPLFLVALAGAFSTLAFGGIIDDFSTGAQILNGPGNDSVTAAGVFKGTRTIASTGTASMEVDTAAGVLRVGSSSGTNATLIWDGDLLSGVTNTPGSVDLTGHVVEISYRSNFALV
jgi:hypothetical protein